MSGSGVVIGVDVGGTFTDVFLLDPAAHSFRTCKVASHRGDEARGFLNGLAAVGATDTAGALVHGTTVGTNALLERRGPKIGIITTAGFRDVLEMRRRDRRRVWGLWGDFIPLVDRDMRLEVSERTLADGTIRRRVDAAEVRAAAKLLLEQGAQSLAVLFINAYANPENERCAVAEIRAVWPNAYVTASHEVLAEIREFERFSTTAINAYLQPVVAAYLAKLEASLWGDRVDGQPRSAPSPLVGEGWGGGWRDSQLQRPDVGTPTPSPSPQGGGEHTERAAASGSATSGDAVAAQRFSGGLHIVQSNGGVMSTASARTFPVRTALSGPAAGVVAATALAQAAGFDNVITCDLGGTSFDVCVIAGGKAAVAPQTTVDFGIVIRTPMIEITTIGAGGGSLAFVDRGGLLQVGPESAGSIPGPACYGHGNTRPTLTDAQLVLGRINVLRPLGELEALDVEAAKRAIATHVSARLGLSVAEAAEAIVRVAEAKMAGAIRLVSIERGHDPDHFILMPFGGGGALHACAFMREIGLKCALVPRLPGITSALGCAIADLKHDVVQTVNLMLDGLDAADLERRLRIAGAAANAVVASAGMPTERAEILYELDMYYLGQTHTLAVPIGMTDASHGALALTQAAIRAAFERAYSTAFSRLLPGLPVGIMSLRATAIGQRPAFDAAVFSPHASSSLEKAQLGERPVWFDGGWRNASLWSRLDLPAGSSIEGPAILEQPDATTVIEPGLSGRTDALGNLIIGWA
jgi:N-methylhydantoinase A